MPWQKYINSDFHSEISGKGLIQQGMKQPAGDVVGFVPHTNSLFTTTSPATLCQV